MWTARWADRRARRTAAADDVGILKLLNRSGAIFLRRLCALKYADLDAHANTPEVAARRADVAAFERRMNELAKTGCYTMRQLAVNGADLMDIGIPAGPGVGATLQTLLNDVMEAHCPMSGKPCWRQR